MYPSCNEYVVIYAIYLPSFKSALPALLSALILRMPTEVYIIKDGDISSTSRTANACHISLKREYQVNDVWSSEIDNDAIYSVLERRGDLHAAILGYL